MHDKTKDRFRRQHKKLNSPSLTNFCPRLEIFFNGLDPLRLLLTN